MTGTPSDSDSTGARPDVGSQPAAGGGSPQGDGAGAASGGGDPGRAAIAGPAGLASRVRLPAGARGRVVAAGALSVIVVVVVVLATFGGGHSSPAAQAVAPAARSTGTAGTATPSPSPASTPTDAPSPSATPAPGSAGSGGGGGSGPSRPGTGLHAGPSPVPWRFQAPSIGVDIPMDAVGLNAKNAMDAPEGSPNDPIWRTGFWYRGGVQPGQPGVATIAAHVDDTLGRPAAFWNLRKLQPGDVVQVVYQQTGEVVRFRISEVHIYSLAQSGSISVLDRLFGPQAVVQETPTFPADGISRLSLVTCTGTFTRGEYDHRYMVFAERLDGPGSPATPASPPPVPG